MNSPGDSGPQFVIVALVAILVIAVIAGVAMAVIQASQGGAQPTPAPILPPILPTEPGSMAPGAAWMASFGAGPAAGS
jgi:hypothetical protein